MEALHCKTLEDAIRRLRPLDRYDLLLQLYSPMRGLVISKMSLQVDARLSNPSGRESSTTIRRNSVGRLSKSMLMRSETMMGEYCDLCLKVESRTEYSIFDTTVNWEN